MRWSELLFHAPCRPQQDTGLYICFRLLQLLLKEEGKHAGIDYGVQVHRLGLSMANPICPQQWNTLDATSTLAFLFIPDYCLLRPLSQREFSVSRPQSVTREKNYVSYDERFQRHQPSVSKRRNPS